MEKVSINQDLVSTRQILFQFITQMWRTLSAQVLDLTLVLEKHTCILAQENMKLQ